MKQNPKPKGADAQCKALTSLNQAEYAMLLAEFELGVTKKLKHYTLKGKARQRPCYREQANSSLYGAQRKLDFILMYMKENPNQAYHGYSFGLSQSKVSEWVYFLTPVLEEVLKKLGFMPQIGASYSCEDQQIDYLLMDVTERVVPRRSDAEAQQAEYSGKKKRHTIKHLAISDEVGYVLFLSDSHEGKMHDKALWDELEVEPVEQNLLADLGFQGIELTHQNAILPFKKPKNGELTPAQKQINQVISRLRIRIEHAFSGIKRLKIIRNKIRLKSYEIREQMMRIATALHNFRMVFRSKLRTQT